MKYFFILSMFSFMGICIAKNDMNDASLSSKSEKARRQFSLFSIVSFKNDQCTTSNQLIGTCVTRSECSTMGSASGNCAVGFGVCCLIKTSTCGGTSSRNCSYIESPSYPSDYSTTGVCSYEIKRCQDDICQIRLDFIAADLQQPDATDAASTTGDCVDTILAITAGTSSSSIYNNPPNLCGTLTGQHLYLDSGRFETAATLKFTLATSAENSWRIKVTQIECWNPARAPPGCLQYFYGSSRHTFTSFNWDGTSSCSSGCLIKDQAYTICFRPERGYCGNQFSETSVTSSNSAFSFDEDTAQESGSDCSGGYIQFNGTEGLVGDRWCGSSFNSQEESTTGGTQNAATTNPWEVTVVVFESEEDDTDYNSAGFSLVSQQKGCYSAYGGDTTQEI